MGIEHEIGADILAHLANPDNISIVHKQDGKGCLHPAACWPCLSCLCPILKRRSIDWIGENSLIKNSPMFCFCHPFRCSICTTIDRPSLMLLDRDPFLPFCRMPCFSFPPVSYATEEDLCYWCWCVQCTCLYRIFVEPCMGQVVVAVPCENGTCCFKCATRCGFCLTPINVCMKDSKTYRAVLIEQVASTQKQALTARQLEICQRDYPQSERIKR